MKIMSWWSSTTKIDLPRLKKYEFYLFAILGFFHRVNPWFLSKKYERFYACLFFGQYVGQEIMFDEILPSKTIKKLIYINTILDFLKELTHDFGQNWNFLFFVLDKMGPEVMFDDHVVKEQAHLDKKTLILQSCLFNKISLQKSS